MSSRVGRRLLSMHALKRTELAFSLSDSYCRPWKQLQSAAREEQEMTILEAKLNIFHNLCPSQARLYLSSPGFYPVAGWIKYNLLAIECIPSLPLHPAEGGLIRPNQNQLLENKYDLKSFS